ncbi:MAG: xanthine dehydrogenase family protein subunit M [Dehalococcoidia bacterium]
MKSFEYYAPTSLREALDIMAQAGGNARALAGGTDLIDQMKQRRRTPSMVMDVKRVPELMVLEYREGEGLSIGAGTACADIQRMPVVRDLYPAIAQSCALIGSVQIQSRASVGGNVCNAAPSADTVPPLIVLGARAVIAGPGGEREVPVEEFFLGPGQTVLAGDELLMKIVVPPPQKRSTSYYLRFIPREEMDIAVAGVASHIALGSANGVCAEARIALAAVAPTPLRVREAESVLVGRDLDQALIAEAAEKAAAAARPITDIRGSAEYRRELVKVLTRRSITGCLDQLQS